MILYSFHAYMLLINTGKVAEYVMTVSHDEPRRVPIDCRRRSAILPFLLATSTRLVKNHETEQETSRYLWSGGANLQLPRCIR